MTTATRDILSAAKVSAIVSFGGNSTVQQVRCEHGIFAVKDYSARADGRRRQVRESEAMDFLYEQPGVSVPRHIGVSPDGLKAVHSWISGYHPTLNLETSAKMSELLDNLHKLSRGGGSGRLRPATDAIIRVQDVSEQIYNRVGLIDVKRYSVAASLMSRVIQAMHIFANFELNFSGPVRTLSPSDFGTHNLLQSETGGSLTLIDLEFFGWDDAHKLVVDSILHPQARWSMQTQVAFLSDCIDIYGLCRIRMNRLARLLGLKWVLIILGRLTRSIPSPDSDALVSRASDMLDWVLASPNPLGEVFPRLRESN